MAKTGIEFNVHASAKDFFFDRQKVINAISAENRKRLSKVGAYIRTRAQKDILRRRKRVSSPGQPPSVHSRDSFATLKNILFFLSADWETVVIGPRVVPSLRLKRSNRQTVPELMEKGGWSVIERGPRGRKTSYTGRYKPRPFMGPALDAEIRAGTIGNLWMRRS